MGQELNEDTETVRKILTADLGIKGFLAKMVPQIVSKDQKQCQYDGMLIFLLSFGQRK
jgi:hypothetical protein